MSSNNLSGTIPEFIGFLPDLRIGNFASNTFTGSISNALGQLTSLEELRIADNFFTGNIPIQLLRLTDLQVFTFDNNDLTGTLPVDFCGVSYDFEVLRADCSEILCTCCTECCLFGICSATAPSTVISV